MKKRYSIIFTKQLTPEEARAFTLRLNADVSARGIHAEIDLDTLKIGRHRSHASVICTQNVAGLIQNMNDVDSVELEGYYDTQR